MSGETPKKVTSAEGDCFLCKDKIPSLKEKVKIFGKSELQIGALIHRSRRSDDRKCVCCSQATSFSVILCFSKDETAHELPKRMEVQFISSKT